MRGAMLPSDKDGKQRLLLVICFIVGLVLTIIGFRFFIVPNSAAFTFGLTEPRTGFALHYVIGLRDIWLGLLAVALTLWRQWLALALWFGLGSIVCLADALIVHGSSGEPVQVGFHVGSGIVFVALAAAILHLRQRA